MFWPEPRPSKIPKCPNNFFSGNFYPFLEDKKLDFFVGQNFFVLSKIQILIECTFYYAIVLFTLLEANHS